MRQPLSSGGLRPTLATLALAVFTSACGDDSADDPKLPEGVTAEVSEKISTVVTVRWTTAEPSIGYVEYGTSEALGQVTPLADEATREHSELLLGLTADTPYYYRVVTWDGTDAAASEIKRVRTGYLPVGMPEFSVAGDGHTELILTPILGMLTFVAALSPEGRVVWYWQDDRDLQFYRARLSRDKTSILYNAANVSGEPAQDSELVRVALDGSASTGIAIEYLAHDFVELRDGTIAAIVIQYVEHEGEELKSNAIIEVAPDGTVTEIWNSLDCFDPAVHESEDPATGWTFANALDFDEGNPTDESDDAYYLGMRNFSSIARINRQTRECEWVLGLVGSTLEFAPGSARFLHQHQFHVFGDRLLVHDNDGPVPLESRVVEYQLDLDAGIATEVWRYTSTPPVYTFVLGETERLAGGDTFIDWSIAGQLERVNAASETTWKLNSSLGAAFGFTTLEKGLYRESSRDR